MYFFKAVEKFFETEYPKKYEKRRSTFIWMLGIAAASGLICGIAADIQLKNANMPYHSKLCLIILFSLSAGLLLTYFHRITRIIVLSLTGCGIIIPVIYLIWKSGIIN